MVREYTNFGGEKIILPYEERVVDISTLGRAMIYRTLTVRGIDTEDINETLRERLNSIREQTSDKVGGNTLIYSRALSQRYSQNLHNS